MKKKIFLALAFVALVAIIALTFIELKALTGNNGDTEVVSEKIEKETSEMNEVFSSSPQEEVDKTDKKEEIKEIERDEMDGEAGEGTGGAEADAGDGAAPAPAGWLSVIDGKLADSAGSPVQLKGLSTHGIAWYPDYINKNFFTELKETWNCNVVRLAMYTAEYGGFCSGGNKDDLYKLIDNGVTYASELGMYVIIDWHILSDNNPNTNKSEALMFFKTVSEKYADNERVIYEICNEPNGSTTWTDIKNYALEVIPVIRENSPNSIIIVGTPRWSQEVDKAAADPITEYDNIMYALHFYADTHKSDLRSTLEIAVRKGLPVFVTEYGICDASGNGAINTSEADKWMELLDKYQISSCAWNISNKGETSAIFKSSVSKKYGFTEADLSKSGQWVLKMLTGKSEYNTDNIEYTEPEDNSQSNSSENNASDQKTYVSQTGPVSLTLVPQNSWESEGKTFTQYSVYIENTNDYDIDSWSGSITFDSPIEVSQGWCANFTLNGNTLTITNADYNGFLQSGAITKDIGCILIQ